MKRYIKLLVVLFKLKLSRDMIYSVNFWIAFFVDSSLFLFQIVAFASIFRFTDTINGWDLNQMIIFIGTFTIVDGLNMATYFFGIISLPEKVRTGNLDVIITKPIDTQFMVSFSNFNPGSLFGVLLGIGMVTYGMRMGGFAVSLAGIAGYVLLVLMMYILYYCLIVLIRICAFIVVKIDAIAQAEDSIVEFAFRIPGTAFRGVSKVIFMVFLPYGLVATVPTQHITNLLEPSQWLGVTMITLAFFVGTRWLFKYGMTKYSSASS